MANTNLANAKIAKLLNVGVEELYNKKFMESVLS